MEATNLDISEAASLLIGLNSPTHSWNTNRSGDGKFAGHAAHARQTVKRPAVEQSSTPLTATPKTSGRGERAARRAAAALSQQPSLEVLQEDLKSRPRKRQRPAKNKQQPLKTVASADEAARQDVSRQVGRAEALDTTTLSEVEDAAAHKQPEQPATNQSGFNDPEASATQDIVAAQAPCTALALPKPRQWKGVQDSKELGWAAQIYIMPRVMVRVGSHYANREAAARAHDRAQLAVKGRCADLLNYPLEEYASQGLLRGPALDAHMQLLRNDRRQDGSPVIPPPPPKRRSKPLRIEQLARVGHADSRGRKQRIALKAKHEGWAREQHMEAERPAAIGAAGHRAEGGAFVPLLQHLPSQHVLPLYDHSADLQSAERAMEEGRQCILGRPIPSGEALRAAEAMSIALVHIEAPPPPSPTTSTKTGQVTKMEREEPPWIKSASPGLLHTVAAMQQHASIIARQWCFTLGFNAFSPDALLACALIVDEAMQSSQY